eukprot:Unigene16661_Nuclearia_a/m.49219 Unigene16661_Nuclearia_a/g.49219  ORF Unigene16661_Nuclearia_a/g.49219 Unigene16661_Nuclearia_a/m.49219 type:complete len:211 (-) Unigene16661_Nuclearia_a:24-656(-)
MSQPLPSAASNTVVAKVMPCEDAAHDGGDLDEVHQRFARCGSVVSYVLFKSLRRAVVVFEDADSAAFARATLHGARLTRGSRLVVSLAENTPLALPAASLLAPPPNPKAFFTSPPPSPPEGWEPALEPPPVAQHANDLVDETMRRLRQLEILAAANDLPSIVVEDVDFDEHAAPQQEDEGVVVDLTGDGASDATLARPRIPQTRRPPLPA